MYIENREKIEKILTNLVKEMERQGIIEVDKKEIESNFKNAREYEIEQMLEKIEDDYINLDTKLVDRLLLKSYSGLISLVLVTETEAGTVMTLSEL